MGDRCYMSVTCRREDKERFEELGFNVAYGEDEKSPVIEMIDEEANYAHADSMPSNIPYYGNNAAGSNYGPGSVVCDGKQFEEVAETSDGFVVDWSYRSGLPKLKSILRIRRYLKVQKRVLKLFKTLRKTKPKP